MSDSKNSSIVKQIITGLAVSLGTAAISSGFQIIKSIKMSSITIGEWDESYCRVNEKLYKIDPHTYSRHRVPTTNKNLYDLEENISYFTKIDDLNHIKVETVCDRSGKVLYPEKRLRITFFGKYRHKCKNVFLEDILKNVDPDHIKVTSCIKDRNTNCDVLPHSFDNIILNPKVRSDIVNGLKNWAESTEWYHEHQLVHKIGIFLYGRPGTGKSTIARAISSMFENAPILIINFEDMVGSVDKILKMRRRYSGVIVVLIEDFDMCFKSREEEDDSPRSSTEQKERFSQNLIFQLLDGVYSTEDTIYIATTNYKDRLDPALIRYGRFDIQGKLEYFNRNDALKCVKMFGYDECVLDKFKLDFPVQPTYLQSRIMEYRASNKRRNTRLNQGGEIIRG